MLKKRALSILLSLAMLLTFMPAMAFADDAADNTADQTEVVAAEETVSEDATAEDPAEGNLSSEELSGEQDETEIEGQSGKLADAVTWKLDAGVLTISGSGKMTNYNEKSDCPWYSQRAKIKKIIIEDGITSIGQYSFVDFTGLERVEIPKSVTNIETLAFDVDTMLEDDCAAKTVYYKGDVASWCKITFAGFTASPCYAGGKLSFNGTDAVDLTIPGSVSSIPDYAFYGCSSLKSATLSEGVKTVGLSAFSKCENMTSVTIPKSLTRSGDSAFSRCSALNDVYYNGDIGSWCNIEFVWYSSNPCDNGCNLYFNKKPAGDQTIPEGITGVRDFTFLGCKNLTGIVIPKSVRSIGRAAFEGCTALKSVTLPDGLETIGWSAFLTCSSLTSITIPASLKSATTFAFDECDKLKDVYYKGDLSKWCSIAFDSVSSNPCCNSANLYFNGTKVTDLTVPGSIKTVGDYTFKECSSLTSVKISDGVTSIGTCAFDSCSNITSVTIPEGVTNIGELSFTDCSKLTSVTIPGSITAVGEAAFDGCKAIKEINYGGDKSDWKSFENMPDRGTIRYSDGSSEVLVPKKSNSDSDEQDDDSAEADSPDDGSHSCAGNIKKVSTAATCQAAGMKKHYECTVCHKMYKDAKGTKALTKKQIKKLKLKKKKHSFKKKSGEYLKSAATCTKPAIYYYTCKMCGQKGKKTYKSGKALGHKYENSVTKATPAKNGSIGQKCTVCGKKGKGKVIPKASKIAVVKKYKKKGVPAAALGGAFIEVRNAKGKKIAASEYDIAFSNDVEAGKGSATITFKGDNYEGSKVVSYKIVK